MKSAEVDRWFKEAKPSAEPAMRRVREIILGADARLTEQVKYGTVHFSFEGDLCAFVQPKKPAVALMFNRGAKIPGKFPHLEGDGPTARFMRFADLAEVEARAAELGRVAAAWCELMSAPGNGPKAPASRKRPARAKSASAKKKR